MREKGQKKLAAQTARELYPYPYRSKAENLTRCIVWIASWILGIAVPFIMGQAALGGAYFIFAASMLVEFIPESRTRPWAKLVHGTFCLLLFVMLIGSFVLIGLPNVPVQADPMHQTYTIVNRILFTIGFVFFTFLFVGIVLVLFEVHKHFYDEKEEAERTAEMIKEAAIKQFQENLTGDLGKEGVK